MKNQSTNSSWLKQTSKSYYTLTVEEVLQQMQTTAQNGLTDQEAQKRLRQFGTNEIQQETGPSRWQILVHQFKDPLIYILLAAAFITFLLQDYVDSGVITVVVLLNAVIGFIQENKAQGAIRALSQLAAPKTVVIRKGRELEIDSRMLVPGDIVLLSSGGRISADMRIISEKGLEVNESTFSGESTVVYKQTAALETENVVTADQKNMVFAGTIVAQGRAKAVVVRTGSSTELGKIAASVKEIGIINTPLQHNIDTLGKYIGLIVLDFSILIAIIGFLHAMAPYEMFITVVAVAVSAIPEGLPVVLTITLAIGVRRMAGRKAIIRSLPAVETLGSTTVIGSDKTGTLTKNEMTVQKIWADNQIYFTVGTGYQTEGTIISQESGKKISSDSGLYKTLLAGTLANEANIEAVESGHAQGDPTEIALHVSAFKGRIDLSESHQRYAQIDLLPFEPERQYMASLNKMDGDRYIFLKGAPEAVIQKCTYQLQKGEILPLDPANILAMARKMASEGLRILAMAYQRTDKENIDNNDFDQSGFIFAGLQGMEDPIRPEASEAVSVAQKAGIRVVMITGDHIDTAVAIG